MPVEKFRWSALQEFRDRTKELEANSKTGGHRPAAIPISLYGRRRVGKSWLFRRFAHGKPAVILVAERAVTGQQLTQMATQLSDVLDVRPQLDTVADLFNVLYDLANRRKVLVVIDEFPYLLGTTTAEQQRTLTSIQAVMERKRDGSKLKLILTGSTISQMEDLQAEKNPLHGRLRPLPLWPMPFAPATLLLEGTDVVEQMTRYSIAGVCRATSKRSPAAPCQPPSPERSSRPSTASCSPSPATCSTKRASRANRLLLDPVPTGQQPQEASAVAGALRMETKVLAGYLTTLESLRLVARNRPAGAGPKARTTQWKCTDHFIRFWFRFVQKYQSELEAGANPAAHVETNIIPHLADHTAPVFEEALTTWMRSRYAGATEVGVWWAAR